MGLKSNLLVMVMVIGALGSAPLMAEAQFNPIGDFLKLISIQGTVFCTVDGNIGTNATSTPVFPNALVQLQCGNGNIVSATTTNNVGVFSMFLDPMQSVLFSLLSNCNLVVKTPMSNCNATLPSTGFLMSSLKFLGNSLEDGLMQIMKVAPTSFSFVNQSA